MYKLLVVMAACIPLNNKFVSWVMIPLAILWLIESSPKAKLARLRQNRVNQYLLGFSLLYFLYVVMVFNTEGMFGSQVALFKLQVKVSLLAIPLFFSTLDYSKFKPGLFKTIQKGFLTGCLLSSLFLLNLAVFQYFKQDSVDVFFYAKLSAFHHSSYLAMFMGMAILILANWLLFGKNKNTFNKTAAIFLILFFQFFIVLLSSKTGILAVLLIYLALPVYVWLKQKNRLRFSIVFSTLFIAALLLSVVFSPVTAGRFDGAKESLESESGNVKDKTLDSSTARLKILECSFEIIKENPIFGVGTGDVFDELMKKYKEKEITHAIEQELNAHNQYLETYMAAGLLGFLLLVAGFVIPLYYAFSQRKMLYLMFLILFFFSITFESMFERQAGVIFYAFFNSVLFIYSFKGDTSNPELS
ncbi:MAG: O-antigen ligase family protein [Bacteroidales bacterium]